MKINEITSQYLDNASLAEQLDAIATDPWNIKYIKNPSESVQLAAVREYVPSMIYIENISLNILNACKQGILKDILTEIRWGRITSFYDPLLQMIHNTGWTELKIIKKSLDVYKFTVR